jgi:MATE family multidrug resistance protein
MNKSIYQQAKPLLTLMLPILGTQLAQTGMGVVDTLVAGLAGTVDLAAIAVGSSIWIPIVLMVSGIMAAITPLVAHAEGANNKPECAHILQQGLYLSLFVGVLCMMLIMYSTRPIMEYMNVTSEIMSPTEDYLFYIALGLPAIAVYQALRSYNEAIHITKPVTVIAVISLLLNIPLNMVFVLGFGPIEAMGGVGCGLASLIIFYMATIALGVFTVFGSAHKQIKPFKHVAKPSLPAMGRISAIGVPIGLAIFVETSLFCVIALLIARLGSDVVAAHQITLNISSLLFMVPLSLAYALTVLIGQSLGQSDPIKSQAIWKNALIVSLVLSSGNAAVLYLLRDSIVAIYSNDLAVTTMASHLLIYAAVYQLSDSAQIAAGGALRGYKDTMVTLILTVISFWLIGLPIGYYLGLSQSAPMGAEGFWVGLVVGLSVNAVLLLARLRIVSKRSLNLHALVNVT